MILKHTCEKTLHLWRFVLVKLLSSVFAESYHPWIPWVLFFSPLLSFSVPKGFCSPFFSAQGRWRVGILYISVVFNCIKVKLACTLCLVVQGSISRPISPYSAPLQRNLKNVGMSWEWKHGQDTGETEKWGVFVGFLCVRALEWIGVLPWSVFTFLWRERGEETTHFWLNSSWHVFSREQSGGGVH